MTTYINNAFDLKRLEEDFLKPLASEGILYKELLLLDLHKDIFNVLKRYEVDLNTIVLLEGVLLYREPIDIYFDFRIYLDISFDEVLRRALKRDGDLFGVSITEKYQQKYIPVQKLYIQKYIPMEKSDVVIRNEDYNNPEIIKIVSNDRPNISKVKLKPAEDKYLADIIEMHKDEEVREMLGIIELPDENYLKNTNNLCFIILDEKDNFIGIVEFFNLSWKNRRAELSIIIKSSFRGKGYGYEAVKKMLDIGFEDFGLNRIWLRVLEHNHRAIELYRRVGLIQEGINREESLRNGRFVSQIQMSILKSEWISKN